MDAQSDSDFAAYVHDRQRQLVRFAYLLCGNAAQAEDLVQSALIKVYRRWSTIQGSPDAYIRSAIINERNSWWRSAPRRSETAGSDLIAVLEPSNLPDTPADFELRKRIRDLPRQQRAAVILRYYEERTEAETAQILGCSVGTVKSHTSRALAALRISMMEGAS